MVKIILFSLFFDSACCVTQSEGNAITLGR